MSRRPIALLPAVALLLWCPVAQGAPVTVGDPFTTTPATTSGSGVEATLINTVIAEPGALASSPVNGAIVRWHLRGAEGGPFRLRILRPSNNGTTFTAVGTSAAATALGTGIETYPTNMPIQAGDLIGLDVIKGLKVGVILNPASVIGAISPILVEGETQPPTVTTPGAQWVFNAEVQPTPTVTALAPGKGSFKGGTKVKVTGTDFASVSTVTFRGLPAKKFTVDSETQITAVAPPLKLGKAGVAVTTVAGTSTVGKVFRATACIVPKLKKTSLKAAKRKLKKASCGVGKVKKLGSATAKTAKIKAQKPGPGKKLAPGTKVSLTLG